ncbi:MAG: hypothetical protein PHR77_02015 [Kiritimatiellae bacterium]|nr:hypothetical protein [Kiritimatiellia bacterium]MDD5521868.1 hypothetical protein [Kiritimatiellia bacterium]
MQSEFLKCSVLTICIIIYNMLSSLAAEEQKSNGKLEAGQETEVKMPDNGREMKVYLPSNYSPDKKWPVIFFFHGMNGKPTTSPIKGYTDGNDFIIIGMPYAAEHEVPKTQQEAEGILQKELANFRSARLWAGKHLKIDERRVFMGGISLGGWETSTLGEYEMPRLAGMFILLAGRQRSKTIPKEAAALQLKPVYIGSGEADPNLIPAFKATATYRKYGAAVTYEIFMGIGHATPAEVPPRFKAWLNAMGKWRAENMTEELRKELDIRLKNQLEGAMAKDNPLAKYNALLDLEADPSVFLCSPVLAEEIRRQVRAVKMASPGREEGLAEKIFFDLSWQDVNMKTIHDLKMVRDGFKKLGNEYPETVFGKYALQYHECLAQMYQKSLESVPGNRPTGKSGTVNFPTGDGRVRPPVIKFKKP